MKWEGNMALFDTLLTSEVARRRKIGEARKKAIADPTKMQDLLAKGMKFHVPEGRKIKTKRHPTKLAATEAAIPKSDPRSKLGTATWGRYTEMMKDPRYKKFAPRDILAASSEIEFDERREATHKYIQKQKVGTFSTFLKEEYAPIPGQEEWEAEHPPRIPHMKAEWSGLIGAGTKIGIEAAKFGLKKGPAAKIGRRGALRLLAKGGPYGKVAGAFVGGIAGMRAIEEAHSRTVEYVKGTEYGKEHPVAAELIGFGAGMVVGAAVPAEMMFGAESRFAKRSYTAIKRFITDSKFRKATGEAVMKNPAAKEVIAFKKAEEAAAKSGDKAVAVMDKDKAAITKNLVEKVEGEALIAKLKDKATPENVGRLDDLISRIRFGSGFAKTEAIAKAGTIARRGILSPEELATKAKLGVATSRPAEGVIEYTAAEKARALKDLMPQTPAVVAAERGGPLALRSIARP
ncbi:MAG: hypothetical protein IMF19_04375, partial [Proteobacteria bacterium]|nr:hypothetical protein [Pseudomonadota bacterium]